MTDISTLASQWWSNTQPPPKPFVHRAKAYYAGIADRWVMDCNCGWHEVDCELETTREDIQARLGAHEAAHNGTESRNG